MKAKSIQCIYACSNELSLQYSNALSSFCSHFFDQKNNHHPNKPLALHSLRGPKAFSQNNSAVTFI